jgi:hypothetical protein
MHAKGHRIMYMLHAAAYANLHAESYVRFFQLIFMPHMQIYMRMHAAHMRSHM